MSTIVLVLPVSQVAVDGGRAVTVATVTNTGTAPETVVLGVFPPVAGAGGGAAASAAGWTSVERPQRELAPDATEQFTVSFAPPATTAAGSYAVRLIAYSAYGAPEESVDQAREVEVTVPAAAATPPPPRTPWWIYAVAAGLVLVVAVVAFVLLRDDGSCPGGSCTTDSPSPLSPSPSASIENLEWVVTGIRESDQVTVPIATFSLRIEGAQVSGSAACNSFAGDWKRDGNLAQITNLKTSLVLCLPVEVNQQASKYLNILRNVSSLDSDGETLELITSDDRSLLFKQG